MIQNLRCILSETLLFTANHIVNAIPSRRFRLWFYRNAMRFEIGPKSCIFLNTWFDTRSGFSMGRGSVINQNCRMDNRGGIQIGDHVAISADVCILTADHDPKLPDFAGRTRRVVIEDYVFIGTRALILPGVTLHRGAIVAAGAIVTKDVPSMAIVAGNPARQIGVRNPALNYTTAYNRLFA